MQKKTQRTAKQTEGSRTSFSKKAPKAKKPHSGLKTKKSSAGLGLFATESIKKGEFVIEYTGERIDTDEADRRGGKYLFTVTKNLVLDGKGREHTARYINHSCKPNCYAEVDEDDEVVNIYAKRNIEAGEELSYDYGKEYFNDHIKPYGCRCPKCAA